MHRMNIRLFHFLFVNRERDNKLMWMSLWIVCVACRSREKRREENWVKIIIINSVVPIIMLQLIIPLCISFFFFRSLTAAHRSVSWILRVLLAFGIFEHAKLWIFKAFERLHVRDRLLSQHFSVQRWRYYRHRCRRHPIKDIHRVLWRKVSER